MALAPPVIQSALLSVRAAAPHPFAGINFDRLALGIGLAVSQWGVGQPQNLALFGAATGLAGVGAINPLTTRLVVPPTVGLMQSALAGAGMVGPLSQSLAVVVTLGISQAFSTSGQYAGVSPTVAVGADISKVTVANGPSLIGILNANLSAVLGPGPALGFMTTGLGMGIASLLLQGTGAGPVTGTPVVPPVASGGVTNSVVV
jgi:hypothetical protein